MALKIDATPVTDFMQNSCIIWDDESMEGIITDVGGEVDKLLDKVSKLGVNLKEIWLTHGHVDHISGVADFVAKRKVPVMGPAKEDDFWIEAVPDISRSYGFKPVAKSFVPDKWLEEGDVLKIGKYEFKVLKVPGHTPGSVVFHCASEKLLLAGDVIFLESIGRTDFPQSSHADLIANIKSKILTLPDDTVIVSGHGPSTTVGHEKAHNPFLR